MSPADLVLEPSLGPVPASAEEARLAALLRHADPDVPASADIEDLVAQAAAVAGVPMATLNLLDAERQCQVAARGVEAATSPRSEAMCQVTLDLGTFVHVSDAREDPRFSGSPWVDGRRGDVRFYASAPLFTRDGYVIGTLCAFDIEPHELSTDQVARLQQLAAQVVQAFEQQQALRG